MRTTYFSTHIFLAAAGLFATAACSTPATSNDGSFDAAIDGSDDAADATPLSDAVADNGHNIYDPYFDPARQSPATAITAPMEQWTWTGFDDAVCANGQATGIGVNLTTRSNRVLIYLQGGGACWDAATCYVIGTAANFDTGYTQTDFQSEIAGGAGHMSIFDRTATTNPFRDYSFVYVPYCTGDVHSGNRVRYYSANHMAIPTFFVGGRNMEVFLRRLVPTFPSADRVILSGASAGGFGAAINWARVQTAFGSTRVDVVDDSGPPLDNDRYATWIQTWNTQFPTGCTGCETSPQAILTWYASHYGTGHRFALLSYNQDATISNYFGITQTQFQTELTALATTQLDPNPWVHYFFLAGTDHTMVSSIQTHVASDGTTLAQFLTQMVTDDPAWHSVGP